jgi:ABC-type multidrug transport system fused ATPase/permease subunit
MLDRWRVLMPNAVAVSGMVALMASLDPMLAIVTAGLAPVMGAAFWIRRNRVAESQRVARKRSGDLAAQISEMARTVHVMQTFGRQDHERAQLDAAGRASALASIEAVIASARLAPLADVVIAINLAVVLALGAKQVHGHQLSVGGLVVFLTYLGALQQPVRAFSRLSRTLGSGLASKERIEGILTAEELPRPRNPMILGPAAPVISAHNLSYTYPDGRQALRGITVCLPAGEITAIEGSNGAGKSTLLSLLLRLDDPSHGVITFNGVDIKKYDLDQLRARIAFVPQEVWLCDGTLLDNIAYGAPDASRPQVVAAGRMALVDEFVDRLPAGWDTPLGEGGAALSGGQRRRVALARAVLRNASILLLDEPTTGLDVEAQNLVIAAIRSAAMGTTTVLVTHSEKLASIATNRVTLASGAVLSSDRLTSPTPGRWPCAGAVA